MGNWRNRRFVFPAAALVAVLAYGALLFNFGPYPEVRERVPAVAFPEERFGFKGPELYEFIGRLAIEEDGAAQTFLEAYKGFQLFDILNGALFALFLGTMVWALTDGMNRQSLLRLLLLFPAAVFAFDVAENIVIIKVIGGWPAEYPGLAALAGTFTLLKMSALFVSLTSLVLLATAALISWIRRRSENAG